MSTKSEDSEGGTFRHIISRIGGGPLEVQLSVRVPWPLHKRVKIACVRLKKTMMQFVAEALTEELERRQKDASSQERTIVHITDAPLASSVQHVKQPGKGGPTT